MRKLLIFSWSDLRIGLVIILLMAAAAGLLCARLTPRGPLTTPQALWSLAFALFLGLAAGLLAGSRWSMLVTPLGFWIAFELARLGTGGPTVDAVHLNSTYGIIAFIVGRFFHALLVIVPMIVGARFGVSLAYQLGNEKVGPTHVTSWIFAGLAALALVVLAVTLARPAVTHPIVGPDGNPLPGSIAELVRLPLGGQEQTTMIRGRSIDNPVLLYMAGGPGGTDLGAMRADVTLEQHFIVVTWDQRGTGKSYPAIDPVETLTLEQMVSDTLELTNYLRVRFHQDKIFLVGNSWGTILGTLAAQRHPELFYAYVGTGQMVSLRETDIMFWEDTLAWAELTGNDQLAATLRRNGPPPYEDLLLYEPAISHEHDWNPYPGLDSSKEMPFNTFVPENTLMDRVNALRGLLDTFFALYPQLQDLDFREDVPSLDLPVYIVIGAYEARGRAVLAREWFEMLDAPAKEIIVFEHSGHRPLFEEPAAFADVMQMIFDEVSP
jgi:pimeloyl-ACP methyl ester carboxylesterase